MRASFVASGVWDGLRRNMGMTIALVLNTAIALLFVGGSVLANTEITRFKDRYESKLNVSVYLCPKTIPQKSSCAHQTTLAETSAVRAAMQADPLVRSVSYISETEALKRAVELQGPEIGQYLKVGDLPASFVVKLKDLRKDYPVFAAKYAKVPGIQSVSNQQETIDTLLDLLSNGRWISVIIALVVLIASVLLMVNTIRTAAAQRKEETGIMRLVGASRWMTELPFVLEAIISTVVGSLIAVGLLSAAKHFAFDNIFSGPIDNGVIPKLDINDVLVAGGFGLIIGVALSAITAFGTLRLYVKL
jgi:cell division transport system permease protein